TLELQGGIAVTNKALNVQGEGFAATTDYAAAIGALRNVGGNNSWAGAVALQGNATDLTAVLGGLPVITNTDTFIEVAAGTRLTLTGVVSGGELVKRGTGTLELAGGIANSFGVTRVLAGTLVANKEPGVTALPGNVFI